MTSPSDLQASEPEIFRHPDFSAGLNPKIFYGFFGRAGGVSTGVFSGLNCGQGSGDDPQHIARNRAIVAARAGISPKNLLSLYQVHGPLCLPVENPWTPEARPQADAMATDKAGIGLGILIADCAPILFAAESQEGAPLIAAAHAGWKGALSGVMDSAVKALIAQGARTETIRACIGPCIGPASYEVGEAFAEPFLAEDKTAEGFFKKAKKPGHLMFDLPSYCVWRLTRAGVGNVSCLNQDTYADESKFYSYRRTTHRKEPDYGRQIAVIAIKI